MRFEQWVLSGVSLLYLAAAGFYIKNFLVPDKRTVRKAFALFAAGFVFVCVFIFDQAYQSGVYLPVSSFYQVLIFFAWAMALIYILLAARLDLESFGVVFLPLLFFIHAAALLFFKPAAALQEWDSLWFFIHILMISFAVANFAFSWVAGLLYLFQHHILKKKTLNIYQRLPDLETLENTVYRTMTLGFVLLSLGLAAGMAWNREIRGALWEWNSKSVMSLLIWGIYLAALSLRYIFLFHGRKVVLLATGAFTLVIGILFFI